MIRAHENPLAWRAGILSVLVHIVLLVILLVSFNWHSAKPLSVAQVELWDSLPGIQFKEAPVQKPVPEPPKPKPVIEKPIAKPVEKPAPPEPKAEIVIKKKPPVEVKPKQEKPKKEEAPKQDPAIKAKEEQKKHEEEVKRLQQMLADEDKNMQQEQHKNAAQAAEQAQSVQSAAALAAEGAKYIGQVSAKIRPYVNKQLCGSGKPVLTYEIALLPTGEILPSPKLIKSSGIDACDDAVYRAILQSNPLPKPPAGIDRDLKLIFHPNDAN